MKAVWHLRAMKGKSQVAKYIRKEFGNKRAKKFRQKVGDTVTMLMDNPYIGKIDPLFEGRALTYRSVIINGLSKMVYYVNGDTIYIAAFWDTRMEPEEQATKVK